MKSFKIMHTNLSIANIKPSTRDLIQFVSPNAGKIEKMIWLSEITGSDLKHQEEKFQIWEDAEIAALIIDTNSLQEPLSDSYLAQALQILSCPILRYQSVKSTDDFIVSRSLGFDAQILPMRTSHDLSLQKSLEIGQSMHFRIIPAIKDFADWNKSVALKPKFVFIENAFPELQTLQSEKTWWLGKSELAEFIKLKCVMETA